MRAHRRAAAHSLLVAATTVLPSACESGSTAPDTLEANVTVIAGADVTTTDEAVIVGGVPRIQLGSAPRGIFVQHHTEYTYGGMHELINDELVEESWYLDLYRHLTTTRGDTVFSRYLDFGDVTLGGTPALRTEIDTVAVYDDVDRVHVIENYILHRVLIYAHRLNMSGSTVSFADEPYYERMVNGGAIELIAGGSDDLEPTSASLTFRPGARVTGLWNGEDLPFDRERPVLRPDRALAVELSRPLDPESSFVIMLYWPQGSVDAEILRRASATFVLNRRSGRIVIPVSALAEMASHMVEPEGDFLFRIYERLVYPDTVGIVREDGTRESLSGVQSNGFGFYLKMRR
jgi:hypothetical protein